MEFEFCENVQGSENNTSEECWGIKNNPRGNKNNPSVKKIIFSNELATEVSLATKLRVYF